MWPNQRPQQRSLVGRIFSLLVQLYVCRCHRVGCSFSFSRCALPCHRHYCLSCVLLPCALFPCFPPAVLFSLLSSSLRSISIPIASRRQCCRRRFTKLTCSLKGTRDALRQVRGNCEGRCVYNVHKVIQSQQSFLLFISALPRPCSFPSIAVNQFN